MLYFLTIYLSIYSLAPDTKGIEHNNYFTSLLLYTYHHNRKISTFITRLNY